jgi:hypothetical protein
MFIQVYLGSKGDRRDRHIDSATNRVTTNGQLTWLIQKGDILLPDTEREVAEEFAFHFRETDDRLFKLPIYEFLDSDMLDQFETAQEGIMERIL